MRVVPIDQTRGLAIAAMILAHFGPGVWNRMGITGPLLDCLLLIGRLATPTFIAIFGFTLAFAYVPKARTSPKIVRAKLIGRSRLVFLAAVCVSIPTFLATLQSRSHWGNSLALNIALDLYGVLFFYTLAILCAGLLIGPISRAPYALPAVMGSGAVFVGTFLGYDAWASQGETLSELFRLVLVSGKYAFFTNFGVALMLVSLGWHMRNLLNSGQRLAPVLLSIGTVMLFLGLGMGRIVGWRRLSDLHSGYDAPPQVWYLCMVVGVMLLAMAFFASVRIPFVSFFLEHTGRNPLSIYVAHAFVLPGGSFLRQVFPNVPDTVNIAFPLCLFLLFWVFVVMKSARLLPKGMAPRSDAPHPHQYE